MGELFRRFWLPVLLSQELPEPDCPPVRVKILGEDLVAFRDTDGRVGLLDPRCPHRGADLFFGRNEECGLRCVYHGWKFDVDGRCVDMPTLPPESGFRDKSGPPRIPRASGATSSGRTSGPPEPMPALPELEFALVPPAHRFVSKKLQQCNWAQSCEGGLDTAHFSFLHMPVATRRPTSDAVMRRSSADPDRTRWMRDDPHAPVPHHAARRRPRHRRRRGAPTATTSTGASASSCCRITASRPTRLPGENYHGQTWVPITDELCWVYCYTWNPERPADRGGA